MLSHFFLMVLYAFIVSLFFTLLWRRAGITELPMNPSADGDFDKAAAVGLALAGTPAKEAP